jgi:hypothetical protein
MAAPFSPVTKTPDAATRRSLVGAGPVVVVGAPAAPGTVVDDAEDGGVVASVPGGPVSVEPGAGPPEVAVVDPEAFPSDESPPSEQAVAARARMRSRTRKVTAAHPRGGVRRS